MNQQKYQSNKDRQLEAQLTQMGFDINQIRDAMKLTKQKQKILQSLITSQQLKQGNAVQQQESLGKHKANQFANKISQKESNKMQIQKNEEDQGYQSVQQQYKMIFLARMDIKLTLATSALAAFKQIQTKIDYDEMAEMAYYQWQESGHKKIVVKVNSQQELMALVEVIERENINVYVKRSSHADEIDIPLGTVTVAAVGPAPEAILDKLTGHLKLF